MLVEYSNVRSLISKCQMITFSVGPNIWCYSCGVLAENGLKPFKLDILEILFIFLSDIYI